MRISRLFASFAGLALSAWIVAVARPARAADPTPVDAGSAATARKADELFQRARAEMTGGALGAACRDFAESQHLEPAVGTLLNLSTCEERAGKLVAALDDIRAARTQLAASDPRASFAAQRTGELEARVPQVTVRLVGPRADGLRVLRDDTELAPAQLAVALRLDPGPHTFVVKAPHRGDSRVEIELGERERRSLDLGAGPWIGEVAPPPLAPALPLAAAHSGSARRPVGILLGSVGLAGVAAGAVLGIVAKTTYDSALSSHCHGLSACSPEGVSDVSRAHGLAIGSTAAFIAGGALVAAGATLYLTAPRDDETALRTALVVGPGQLSLRAQW